ncbi:hypothetical protein H490_0102870 [Leucobacter sp. UCD-THU]|uniref:DUF3237 domain-containing protein n=1 Tax=Leucobacter sp. UCD-THU TaxID=1292023 RepID=UPI000366FAC4|nr:DUF3237 domain-containing protein [Leucobacter sp. UCD-THU]EYT56109.1 hypothetical protein H490_0102870 [Leucobacter sp. UCD-THU]
MNDGAGIAPGSAPSLIPVCEVVVELGEPLDFGPTRDGARRFTPIVGGELRGMPGADAGEAVRGLRAAILPGGGDRQLLRAPRPGPGADAAPTVEIDARYDARTADGALIGVHAIGIRRVLSGESGRLGSTPPRVYFRVMLRLETAEPSLAELQEALFIADGVREADRVRHTVYRVG